ncbi:MAG: hypothetical protein EXR75_14700 [Myxococcales bacterium]|nr:hypothetical protein [Myxococcales bacterium]
MGTAPRDEDPRTDALLLSSLVLTDDAQLATFRTSRAANASVAIDDLRRARTLLSVIVLGIRHNDSDVWRRLRLATDLFADKAHEQEEPRAAVAPKPPPAFSAVTAPISQPAAPATPLIAPPAMLLGRAPAAPRAPTIAMPAVRAPDVHALPFVGARAAPPSAVDDEPHPAIGETGVMQAPLMDDILPFSPRNEGVEWYAALCAERAARPTELAALCARYALDGQSLAQLDADWHARMGRDSAVREAFSGHYWRYWRSLGETSP